MKWTDEHKTALRDLVGKGLNGTQILKQMTERFGPNFNRSVISGAIRRLKLKLASPKALRLRPPPKMAKVEGHESACTFMELTRYRCRFPLWDHTDRATLSSPFCGAKTKRPPYCAEHGKVTFNSPRR